MPPIPRKKTPKLRKPQIEILKVLGNSSGCFLARKQISERSGIAENALCPMLGSHDELARKKAEKRGNCISLVSLKYVDIVPIEVEIGDPIVWTYVITPQGKKVLDDTLRELARSCKD